MRHRKPEHDIGSVQNIVNQYTRQRAMLRGEKKDGARGSATTGKKGKK